MYKLKTFQYKKRNTAIFWFTATYLITLALLFDFVFITPAYAYIDPNTGGFFFQTVAPIIYGLLGVIVVYWKRVIGFAKRIVGRLRNRAIPPSNE